MTEIIEDTRQQVGKHNAKHAWFEQHGIQIVRRKLDFGDYSAAGSNIVVDTKKNMLEVAKNLTKEHDRFVRECIRAYSHGYRLIILVEGTGYRSIDDVTGWMNTLCRNCTYRRSKICDLSSHKCIKYHGRRPVQGPTLAKTMHTFEAEYECRFEFCHSLHTAKRIVELLGVSYE